MRLRDRLLISGAIAAAGGLIIVAAAVGGDAGKCAGQPAAIEAVTPACGAAALQLDTVSVDLAPGYEGELQINGVPVPAQYVASLNLISYKPGPGKPVARLNADVNQARVTFWRSDRGRDQSQNFAWTFKVN